MKLLQLLFHPHFVLKYYLYQDIFTLTTKFQFKGSLLDIGCGSKPYQDLFSLLSSYNGIDFNTFSPNKEFSQHIPDYFFPNSYRKTGQLPFDSNTYHIVTAFQVLEHHSHPEKLISEMRRIVKKNGYILLSFPYLTALHEEPHDYQRITPYGITSLLESLQCKIIFFKSQGSIFSTCIFLFIDYFIEQSQKSFFHALFYKSIFPLFYILSLFSFILDPLFPSKRICLNYLVVAKKIK